MLRPKCSVLVLEGQVLEHVLRHGKIKVLSARARYRAPNAGALLIIGYGDEKCNTKLNALLYLQYEAL